MMIDVVCDGCGSHFKLTGLRQSKLVAGRKQINVTYFVCPSCSKLYVVSVTDFKWQMLSGELQAVAKRVRKAIKKHDETLLRKLYGIQAVKKDKLASYESSLLQMYRGRLTMEPDGRGVMELCIDRANTDMED